VIQAGDEPVMVDTPVGRMGLAVCYDVRFPELFRHYFHAGVDIFVLPTAFTVPTGKVHWEVLTCARAIENLSYFVGACQSGVHSSGRETYGHSVIVDPWGEVVASLVEGAGVIVSEVDLKFLEEVRRRIPVKEHVRL